jgi:FMNH2-dependent dimethyl sulfone monooxygenase
LILGGFLHFIEEVDYFGTHVLPIVRELEAGIGVEAGVEIPSPVTA